MSSGSDRRVPWRWLLSGVAFAIATLIAFVLVIQPANRSHGVLTSRQLETPKFAPPPPLLTTGETLARVWSDLQKETGAGFLDRILPTQSGTLWIALIVALVVGFDTARLGSRRNIELLGLLVIGFLLFDVMRFFSVLKDPVYFRVMDWVFSAVVATSLGLAARAAWRVWRPDPTPWQPNLPSRVLFMLTFVLFTISALVVTVRAPDDAGFYTNLGGQRLRESGMFPYGDPLLTGSPAAAYGPVLFLAHIPFQWLLDGSSTNPETTDHPLAEDQVYHLPSPQASQLATLAFHVIGVIALWFAARRLAGIQVAWALTALYCGSAYVLGVGGPPEMIGGLTFISHTAPPALAVLAFACLGNPLLAGLFLALSIATVFYPMFFIPAWIGYYLRTRGAVMRFVAGMAIAAVVVGAPVLARSRPIEGHSLIGTIVQETLGHHQGADTYGLTTFSFWGQRGGVRAWLQHELIPGQAASTPVFLAVAGLAALALVPARGASPQQLALLSGAIASLVGVWKILGTGVYVNWYYPFLLLGFFAHGRDPAPNAAGAPLSTDRGADAQ